MDAERVSTSLSRVVKRLSRVVKRESRVVNRRHEGNNVKRVSRVVKRVTVKSCQEGGMRVTVSRRRQELSRVCQDCITKEHGAEGQQVPA